MQTQKIPFSIDKMKDAIRYETRDGREVTQVTVFDIGKHPVYGVVDGKIYTFGLCGKFSNKTILWCDLFIIIKKPIEYPCLCWASDTCENPSKHSAQEGDAVIDLMVDENKGCYGTVWSYSTPLTDDELAEFGLMRAEK